MVDKSTPITRTPTTRGSDAGRSPGRPAAGHGDEVDHLVLDLPIVGTLRLPRPEQVAYYGAVGVLVALDIVEWLAYAHATERRPRQRQVTAAG